LVRKYDNPSATHELQEVGYAFGSGFPVTAPPCISFQMLTLRVCPGVFDVRTSDRRCIIALSKLDLPTLERPANAISGKVGAGSAPPSPVLAANAAETMRDGGVGVFRSIIGVA